MNVEEPNAKLAIQPMPWIALAAISSPVLLWLSQPPAALWPLALVALVPWLLLIQSTAAIDPRGYIVIWITSAVYWWTSLQGLRHAHPAMCIPLLALGAYLAIYPVMFVAAVRRISAGKRRTPLTLLIGIPIAWVTTECLRNYLLTGISALMLGHTMADVPTVIQIADLAGSYGVSFLVAMINASALIVIDLARRSTPIRQAWVPLTLSATAVIAALLYGNYRLGQPTGPPLASIALIQRSETVDYGQPIEREREIFQNYVSQSVNSVRAAGKPVDVVVWPESMFSGGLVWMLADADAVVPEDASMSPREFQLAVAQHRAGFLQRAGYVQDAIASVNPSGARPHLLVGCGVVHYRKIPQQYSGVLSITPDSKVADWYGKTHLVMFGEYIPIAPSIPGLRSFVPPGLGLQTGSGGKQFSVAGTSVSPNICIETAVERVTVNQLAHLLDQGSMPDAVVTVTNDGWFDDSSVIDHHLRCAQLVAVGCRRPVLSAANNGPTAWIDSCGRIVQRLPTGTHGAVIAAPRKEQRTSLYLTIGDWPAWFCVLISAALLIRARITNVQRDSH